MLAAQEKAPVTVAMEQEELSRARLSLLSSEQLLELVLQQGSRIKELEKTVEYLKEEAFELRKESVSLARINEVEQECIANKLLRKIDEMERDKAEFFKVIEMEEEHLTNNLNRRLSELEREKVELEICMEQEQEYMVNKLRQQVELSRLSTPNNNVTPPESTPRQSLSSSDLYFSNSLVHAFKKDNNILKMKLLEQEKKLQTEVKKLQAENGQLLHQLFILKKKFFPSANDEGLGSGDRLGNAASPSPRIQRSQSMSIKKQLHQGRETTNLSPGGTRQMTGIMATGTFLLRTKYHRSFKEVLFKKQKYSYSSSNGNKVSLDKSNIAKYLGEPEQECVSKDRALHLHAIFTSFKAPIRFAFAYGSSVFPQNHQSRDGMTDFIFAVNNSEHWHWQNLQQNSDHYSLLKYCGSKSVARIQEDFGASVYFNAYANVGGTNIKYGIISVDHLIQDLVSWNRLYISGRMQKPILILKDDKAIREAQQKNLASALNTSLLLLPSEFSERQLFIKIAQLSYLGDVRMKMAENPNKVGNIVSEQHRLFRRNYEQLVDNSQFVSYMRGAYLAQDCSLDARIKLIANLPKTLLQEIFRIRGIKQAEDDTDSLKTVASDVHLKSIVEDVNRSSLSQSLKGILTGGVCNSLKYAARKIRKRMMKQ